MSQIDQILEGLHELTSYRYSNEDFLTILKPLLEDKAPVQEVPLPNSQNENDGRPTLYL
jgi:hypothetical protein